MYQMYFVCCVRVSVFIISIPGGGRRGIMVWPGWVHGFESFRRPISIGVAVVISLFLCVYDLHAFHVNLLAACEELNIPK